MRDDFGGRARADDAVVEKNDAVGNRRHACKVMGNHEDGEVKALAQLHETPALRKGWLPPKRIVYVSCNPATLARDAGLLVHVAGYRCVSAGVVNMFAHTAHVESMAVFELV